MNDFPRKSLLAVMISSAVVMTGCGGGGSTSLDAAVNDPAAGTGSSPSSNSGAAQDSTGGSTSTAPGGNLYSGSSSISGSVALSALGGADAASLKSASTTGFNIATRSLSPSTRAGEDVGADAVIKLFAVAENGELKDTGIACEFDQQPDENGNPQYSCSGIADGKNYVVKYLRLLANNKALEMKVNVEVPEGAAEAPAEDVSPQSTLVVDTIVNAILTATEGKEIDKDIVKEIIGSVKEVVKGLIESGAVAVPSMVVDAPKDRDGQFITDARKLEDDDEVEFDTNDNLDSAAGSLLSSDEVSKEVAAVKVEIEVREIKNVETDTVEGKKRLIEKIFSKLLDGEVPEFMVDFFAEKFAEGSTLDVASLFKAIKAGLQIHAAEPVDLAELGLSVSGSSAALADLLDRVHYLEEQKAADALTELEKQELSEIPGIIPAIFPAVNWKGAVINGDTRFDIPQSIVFTIFLTDKYVPDVFQDVFNTTLENQVSVVGEGDRDMEIEHMNPVDFNPMFVDESGENPGLLQLLGFFDEKHLASLKGYEISHLDVMPEKAWINDESGAGGSEYDMLRANVCVTDLSAMARMGDAGGDESELSVALEYPASSGERKTVELLDESELYGPMIGPGYIESPDGLITDAGEQPPMPEPQMDACFTLDPWASAQKKDDFGSEMGVQISKDDIISDFVSGAYRVLVKNADGTIVAEREFKKKVITGMANVAPIITSPNGMPQWPAECNFSANGCPQWDEAMQKWTEAGGNTTFPLNADGEGAKVSISWKKPDLKLPEGVKVSYSLDLVKNGFCDTEGCDWEHIYSTWEDDKRLFGTSFTLPEPLEKLEAIDGQYHVNVCAEFIDTDNGEYLGAGGCGFAEFNVGEPLDLAAEFSIEGKAAVGLEGNWKVALVAEEMSVFTSADEFVPPARRTVIVSDIDADGQYALKPMIGDFLGAAMGTYFNIVMFDDVDDDGEFDSSETESEPSYWPDSRSNIWFETWGQILRVVSERGYEDSEYKRSEQVIIGGESVEGPDFSYLKDEPWFENYGDNDPAEPLPVDGSPEPYFPEEKPVEGGTESTEPPPGDQPPPVEGEPVPM